MIMERNDFKNINNLMMLIDELIKNVFKNTY